MKVFMAVQKQFFGEVLKMYFAPVMVVFAFLGIYTELIRQALICLFMDSVEFGKLQDLKLKQEEDLLIANMGDKQEFEDENFEVDK